MICRLFCCVERKIGMKIDRDKLVISVEGELCAGTEAIGEALAEQLGLESRRQRRRVCVSVPRACVFPVSRQGGNGCF